MDLFKLLGKVTQYFPTGEKSELAAVEAEFLSHEYSMNDLMTNVCRKDTRQARKPDDQK